MGFYPNNGKSKEKHVKNKIDSGAVHKGYMVDSLS